MTVTSVSEMRKNLASAIDAAQEEAVFVERHGAAEAVLISALRYEQLMDALEEIEDIADFDEAMAEEGENIPWDVVKAELGWS
ncbi:PHD/YefM family antitoxin component YafN of YafNO toxin-antitoxin module [Arcanobacterium wilhelmae]|uniref:Antitoxin n=1 Tax=Arcanobacterium wilhelmae TaxID=1803177 RepID=A0ABT9NC38_9ACTO|nr:type II toxin-antitoxin system Phd/YefM family antitoxin [Arcanobacterium wilhelmae]MDP9801268.1 PHD/YefM family antitoxin component YafN of YafNO toxin-antitoxin module [Arcanobacterium wilhelmae]WFN90614.1 type II toxin-antitoxin system Phd/YefM family antitoxin [Arcanobacterium wilhelmae]